MADVKREYHSPRRRAGAEATRRALMASARTLFAAQGYAATSIEAIAREAGVAVQTFYATFGSKRAILRAVLDESEREADFPALTEALHEAASDPRRELRAIVDFNVRLFPRIHDVLEVVRAAGTADADLVSFWREGEVRRRAGQAPLVRRWARTGALRAGVSAKEAADVLWALTGPDTYRLFAIENGWSARHVAEWLFTTLERLLLESSSP